MYWLKKIREEKHMSQESIAVLIGIRQSGYSMIEIGNRRPSVGIAKKIAAVLEFDWTRFYEEGNEQAGSGVDSA